MQPYLTENGRKIYQVILAHIDKNNWSQDIDDYELSMLANAFDTYEKCALTVQRLGMTQTAKNNFETSRPENSIMEKVYGIILKHSAKFGLNPGDRKKIFKVIDTKRKKKGFITLGDDQIKQRYFDWWASQGYEGDPDIKHYEDFKAYFLKHREEPEDLLALI